jgi:hypothetical protein
MSLLVDRLKYAKLELTALKTAHKRGLGLLKVDKTLLKYSDTSINDGYSGNAVLTVDFDESFGAYPFTYVEGRIDGERYTYESGYCSADMKQVRYTNNGYRVIFKGHIWYEAGTYFDRLFIYSTSPVKSVTLAKA